MLDRYDRQISYLRISVTDHCNVRCTYCMPADGAPLKHHREILSFEDIVAVVREAVKLGIVKVRLTGGEPLMRRDIVTLVRMLAEIEGLEHLAMTTNGSLLDRFAGALREAGLDSVNISVDTLDPQRYRRITRIGNVEDALRGVDAALAAGFPIKINMVVSEETSDTEVREMERFCDAKGMGLQLINHYSLDATKRDDYEFSRPPKCDRCNRIRLLADGTLKPCLHTNREVKVDMEHLQASLMQTVLAKPRRGAACTNRSMMEIGG
jgi:GTP 3',8-cyclase